jgi:hypothetical protein
MLLPVQFTLLPTWSRFHPLSQCPHRVRGASSSALRVTDVVACPARFVAHCAAAQLQAAPHRFAHVGTMRRSSTFTSPVSSTTGNSDAAFVSSRINREYSHHRSRWQVHCSGRVLAGSMCHDESTSKRTRSGSTVVRSSLAPGAPKPSRCGFAPSATLQDALVGAARQRSWGLPREERRQHRAGAPVVRPA